MCLDAVDRRVSELRHPIVGRVTDVVFHVLRGHSAHGAHFEGSVDECIFDHHDLACPFLDALAKDFAFDACFAEEGIEQLDQAVDVESFIADRPGDDLAHAEHFAEPLEVHEHRELAE